MDPTKERNEVTQLETTRIHSFAGGNRSKPTPLCAEHLTKTLVINTMTVRISCRTSMVKIGFVPSACISMFQLVCGNTTSIYEGQKGTVSTSTSPNPDQD